MKFCNCKIIIHSVKRITRYKDIKVCLKQNRMCKVCTSHKIECYNSITTEISIQSTIGTVQYHCKIRSGCSHGSCTNYENFARLIVNHEVICSITAAVTNNSGYTTIRIKTVVKRTVGIVTCNSKNLCKAIEGITSRDDLSIGLNFYRMNTFSHAAHVGHDNTIAIEAVISNTVADIVNNNSKCL